MKPWHEIPGWFNFHDVYSRAVQLAPDGCKMVEVGCWKGKSMAYLVEEVRRSGKDISLCAVDTFQGSEEHHRRGLDTSRLMNTFLENMDSAGINVYHMESVKAAEDFEDGSVFMVFLDASHDAEGVANDVRAWWPKVQEDGLLAGDDLKFKAVQEGLKLTAIDRLAFTSSSAHPSWMIPKGDPERWKPAAED